jgi:DNA repair protein RecO (recombination protein O)
MNAPIPAARARPAVHEAEPGFVLHSYPFKETSLIVEIFARGHGRVPLVAKGARRPKSALRGLLMPFQPLLLWWSGRAELRQLHKAEWQAGHAQLSGVPLVCAFYLNELLLKLLVRDDAHEGLYAAYEVALAALRAGESPAAVLRRFEKRLLAEIGYALLLDADAEGEAIDPDRLYTYAPERGPVRLLGTDGERAAVTVSGRTLADMALDDYASPATLQESRALMRHLLNHHLAGQELHTRQLLRELQQL